MGDRPDDILRLFKLSAEDAKKYQTNLKAILWNVEM